MFDFIKFNHGINGSILMQMHFKNLNIQTKLNKL